MENKGGIRSVLAANVRKMRKERGMTQEALAELAGISNTYVANIEHAKTWTSDTTLERIAAALGAEPHELLVPYAGEGRGLSKFPESVLKKILSEKERKLSREISLLIEEAMREVWTGFCSC